MNLSLYELKRNLQQIRWCLFRAEVDSHVEEETGHQTVCCGRQSAEALLIARFPGGPFLEIVRVCPV